MNLNTTRDDNRLYSREYICPITERILNIYDIISNINNHIIEERAIILNSLSETSQLLLSQRDNLPLPDLNTISTIITEINKNIECPICCDDYDHSKDEETNKIFIKLNKCNHIFHKECMENYIKIKKQNITCPYCRSDFTNP